jgi:hypothetical protein
MLCRIIIVGKSKEVKIGSNLAESSKIDYGSERAVLPMMVEDYRYMHKIEVFTAVFIVVWVVTPCSLVGILQRFRGTCCIHL